MVDLTSHQLEEARRRLRLVEAIERFPTLKAAAAGLGEPVANLCRYRRAYDGTLESLAPNTTAAGRPAAVATLSKEEIDFAKTYLLKTESIPLALEYLADSPVCSHDSRELLNRYRERRVYPPSIVTAIRFSDEEWDHFRGRKHAQNGKIYNTRRGMFAVMEDGSRREVTAGDLVEGDDVSLDTPYYVRLPDGSYRVGRQVIAHRDVRTGKWLHLCAVAREKDSYRAEDIVRAVRWMTEAHGLVGRLRYERGSWESLAIMGQKTEDGERWGGLAQLVPIDTCYSSNGKAIESGFTMLQKILGAEGVRIGRTRGEYEAPTADMLAVNAGKRDPRTCGFIAWEELLTKFERAFTRLNGRARNDRHTGQHISPDELWWADMQERRGKRLPVCHPDLFYHFLPVKAKVSVGSVVGGHVQVSLKDYPSPFLFRCAGEGIPYLERGHKVWVCFDPIEAAQGAVIFNAEPSCSPRNRGGYRPQERLFVAELSLDRPQWDDRPAGERGADPDVRAKKTRHAQVKAAATSLGLFGQGARRVQSEHDGAGGVRKIESGAAAVSPAPCEIPAGRAQDTSLTDMLAHVGDTPNPGRDRGESPILDARPTGRISRPSPEATESEDDTDDAELAALEAAEAKARDEELFI